MSVFLEELLGDKLVTGGGEEVDVHSLGARGIALLGLYFGCSLSAPCAQLSASLAAFYSRLRGDTAAGPGAGAGAGAAAEPEPPHRLEIVFVSSDQDQRQWQDFVRDMPWLALPYKEKHRKLKLWNKYRISNIPSLIFLDATTGKVVCRNGLLVIRDDPEGLEFPWGPKPFREVVAGPLLRNNGPSLESSSLEGSHVGVYFSAHWCPPCRSLTRVLVESYRKIKEAGQKFEIIFVSADRSEESFKQYFSEMPWLAVPYTDDARRSRLNRLYGIQGIPTLIVLDPQGEVITRQGRVEVLNDEDCREFPWHPKPVLELSDSNAVQLNEGPCLVLFVDSEDDGESEAAKQLIQPIAEKIIAKYKAKEEEAPLLFFVAGEVLRHEEFEEGCKAACNGPYDGKWSKTMVGFGPEDDHFVAELTYNYGIGDYKLGNDFMGITLASSQAVSNARKLEWPLRKVAEGVFETEAPGGYKFYLQDQSLPQSDPVLKVTLAVTDIQKSLNYWSNLLGMNIYEQDEENQRAVLGYADNQCKLELQGIKGAVDHAAAFGRIAFSCPQKELPDLEDLMKRENQSILTPLVSLDTPGKATVQVVILADPDGHEICFVGDEAFRELSKRDPKGSKLLDDAMAADKSDEWFATRNKPKASG